MLRRFPTTIALVAWTGFVWTTRIGNIWRDDALTTGERWARTGLAASFTALAAVVVVALVQRASWTGLAVKALAGWTIGVWVVRVLGIARGGHDVAFVVVHLVLALASTALALLAVREAARVEGRRVHQVGAR